jgi:hypothetical protein
LGGHSAITISSAFFLKTCQTTPMNKTRACHMAGGKTEN